MMKNRVWRWLAAAWVAMAGSSLALADKLILKDGRTLEGTVQREGEEFVYFVIRIGGLEKAELFLKKDIARIERDEPKADGKKAETPRDARPAEGSAKPAAAGRTVGAGAARIAFIQLGDPPDRDMVGPYMNAGALKKSVELLEPDKPDIVVLLINSGGGALIEIQKLSDVIEKDLKPKYRTVAWIHSAISAAAMTAHTLEEIYFMSKGNYGACTGFSMSGPGQAKAVEGRDLEYVLYMMEKISARGGKNPLIMRSMQIEDPLSCDIDSDGVVRWRADEEGQFLVNPKGRILTFNAQDAMKYKFAKGIADTKDELARLLVGETEWVEVGQAAAAYQEEYRRLTKSAELGMNQILLKLDLAMQGAMRGGADAAERGARIGEARRWLNEIKSLARRSPGVSVYFAPKWFIRATEEQLRRLQEGLPAQWPPQPTERDLREPEE